MNTADTVQRAIDYIEERLFEVLALEEIAKSASMSLPNLYRMFYATTGHPIKEYIRKRRISEAAILLRYTDFPTNDIGFRTGFDTYQAFIKAFKRCLGMTPGQYRQAEMIFSFEKMNLREIVDYMEEREISERYSDVKVIRLASMKGIGYLYTADREDGVETDALRQFRIRLAECQLDSNQLRIFGWNVDTDDKPHRYGYQLMAVGTKETAYADAPDLFPIEWEGGLYAATRVTAKSDTTIVEAWNRLLSDWLPRSTFELGEHRLVDEFQHFGDKRLRLKLYLPVRRKQQLESIKIVERSEAQVICFRAVGHNRIAQVNEDSVHWLNQSGVEFGDKVELFMSCTFPPNDSNDCYELFITLPEEYASKPHDEHLVARLEGGLYACLTTGVYGLMTGVVERIYLWLASSEAYEPDTERKWYARYNPDEERSHTVTCYVPILSTPK
ncbi:helix-turn-helix domain-containing protein [Paenibacillus sp. 2TAB19]|uniref:helix-turn-helix domain-containing protein n=1 Tax=Paenibacillus sp. 2TAB19 TaxID=3233003 RepID=UPI003F982108